MKYIVLVVFLSAVALSCSFKDAFKAPDRPINGICWPGATYVCPCCDETWESAWKSGTQYCDESMVVSSCDCSEGCDGGADADAD